MKPKSARTSEQLVDPLRSTVATASQISRSQSRNAQLGLEHECVYNMNDCFQKLKGMVPNVPSNKRLTRVEILQCVIDYIQDLQYELQDHPTPVHTGVGNERGGAERIPLSAITFNQLTDTV